jgi:hypothetical protein
MFVHCFLHQNLAFKKEKSENNKSEHPEICTLCAYPQTFLLKQYASYISETQPEIVRTFVKNDIFPSCLKESSVKSILKQRETI